MLSWLFVLGLVLCLPVLLSIRESLKRRSEFKKARSAWLKRLEEKWHLPLDQW